MKKFAFAGLSLVLVATALTIGTDSAQAGGKRVNQRQVNQQRRIFRGASNGSLTGREAVRLQKQQVRLARKEHQMRQSGDGLTKVESVKLEHMQDNMSQNVYKQKHDGQTQ